MRKKDVMRKANEILEYYEVEKDLHPLILYGKEARKFYVNHLQERGLSRLSATLQMRQENGMFLHQNLNVDYIQRNLKSYMKINNVSPTSYENGVICLFSLKLSSLAHEIRHSCQMRDPYMKSYMNLEGDEVLKEVYGKMYVYYPNERDAFQETLNFLRKEGKTLDSFRYLIKIASLEFKYALLSGTTCKFHKGIFFSEVVKVTGKLIRKLHVKKDK